MIFDLLSKDALRKRGFLNYSAVEKILIDNFSGKEDNALKIWQLLTIELWFKTFVDGDGSKPLN